MRKYIPPSLVLLALFMACAPARAELPSWLPRYNLDIHLATDQHMVEVRELVTWTNRHERPAEELVFNAHAHFKLPDGEVGKTAKIIEILRMMPSEALDLEGRALEVSMARLVERKGAEGEGPSGKETPLHAPRALVEEPKELAFHYQEHNDTALVVPLSRPVAKGESVTVELTFHMRLPQKQGRWGQWAGVTYLSNWLPVLAFYDDHGWQPTPFVPWHQPFFNESGIYSARLTLPCDQKVGCTGTIVADRDLGNGQRQLDIVAAGARDFAVLASACFAEFTGQAGPVRVRCLAMPKHEHYARVMIASACYALTAYSRWFGPYPYDDFTIVESYFGWNGNECSGLVMIDERIFGMPHVAESFVDYLVAHETCHQWWYNVVGTNGYSETWMDEGLATYFSYRLMNEKYGKNNSLINYPRGLGWLPNIKREDYRLSGLFGTVGRGEACPTIQELPKFGHIINLFSMCYDKGSKIVGMIEERLGEAAFLDFMRRIYVRYQFRILRVADFQRELEEFTGQSWDEFFHHWLHGAGMPDWCVEKVHIKKIRSQKSGVRSPVSRGAESSERSATYHATVILHQKGDFSEPTVLGFSFKDDEHYEVRIPIVPQHSSMEVDDLGARVEALPDNRVRVEIDLPARPRQISVDPDQVLLDREPANNHWKPRIAWHLTPCSTFFDETDLTTAHDRWNVVAGPWIYMPTYENPWFTRATMFGVHAAAYRTQKFDGNVYAAYRTDYRDVVAGVDGLCDHWPWCHTQVGFVAERRLAMAQSGDEHASRAVVFGRYVIDYGDSFYLPPFQFVQAFTTIQDNLLPFPRQTLPGSERYNYQYASGVNYHINYLTPYWDAEGGFLFDATYAGGVAETDQVNLQGTHQFNAQMSHVQFLPECLGCLSKTRLATRLYGAAGLPDRIQFYPMGGGTLFRGFDLAQRQGSLVWVASLEWRVPLTRNLNWDCCDHAVALRNIYGALFYDVGDTYVNGQSLGGVAHAVGAGLRLDVAWFTFVERTIFRLDAAKTVNDNTPVQFWMGLEHPF